MINGLEGIPGSGKSYEAVVYQILEALKQGRKVITNLPLMVDQFAAMDPQYRPLIELRVRPAPVRGTWDATRMDESGNGNAFELFEDGRTEPAESDANLFGTVWCFWTDWRHPDPKKKGQGPLFAIDECHVALPANGTEKEVVEWFKLHRHFGCDVLLMTQSFRDINQPIARLMDILIKVRKANVIGKADHYIRKVHGGYRGAEMSREQRKYRPEMFRLYKSHTQGSAVLESGATDVAPFNVKFQRFTKIFMAVAICACAYALWPKDKPSKQALVKPPERPASAQTVSRQPNPVVEAETRPVAPTVAAASAPVKPDEYPEPYAAHKLHVTGHIQFKDQSTHTFAVVLSTAVLATVTTRDLQKAGYKVEPLSDCTVILRFRDTMRTVVCDLPAAPKYEGNRSNV